MIIRLDFWIFDGILSAWHENLASTILGHYFTSSCAAMHARTYSSMIRTAAASIFCSRKCLNAMSTEPMHSVS